MIKATKRVLILFVLAGILIGTDMTLLSFLLLNVGPTPAGSLASMNEPPTVRNVIVEWTTYASGQDKFEPEHIIINQGDTVHLTFINNDTDAHTFSVTLPSGFFQLNASAPGAFNSQTHKNFTTPATGCFSDGKTAPCNAKGKVGSLVLTGMFTANKPGIYQFTCVYHPPMFGYLVVLPNAGFKQQAAALGVTPASSKSDKLQNCC
jgi:plastocyanin